MVLYRSLWPIHSCTRRTLVRAIIVVAKVWRQVARREESNRARGSQPSEAQKALRMDSTLGRQ